MKYRDMNVPATQREKADERQVMNSAGGYVYQVGDAERLRRFLVLGTEGGTFYASQRDLTKQNVDFLKEFARKDPIVYYTVLETANEQNIAPRHSTVLLALAVLYTHAKFKIPVVDTVVTVAPTDETGTQPERQTRKVKGSFDPIKANFTKFVRTGTHLFEFVDYVTQYRAWGRGLRTLIASWYLTKEPDDLAYQIVKYRQRGGWSHRDLLRKAHPKTKGALADVLDYAAHGTLHFEPTVADGTDPEVIQQFEAVKNDVLGPHEADALSWEMLPTESLTNPVVWRALIAGRRRLPYTAMLRNLGRMTSIGVFDDAASTRDVVARLSDPEYVRRARVHPFNVLTALKTYSQGGGFRGSLQWAPKQAIVDALDAAFYASFGNVESTGKRINIALDVSGSMSSALMNSNVTAREGSVAMAMATLAADPDTTDTIAFTSGGWSAPPIVGRQGQRWGHRGSITELGLSTRRRLDDIVRETARLPMGGTDCALPIIWAIANKRVYDAFVVMTDNETWAGAVQPMDALRTYRAQVNPSARLIVVGMTSTGFSIADPNDQGCLDVVGFDASAPRLIGDFIGGKF